VAGKRGLMPALSAEGHAAAAACLNKHGGDYIAFFKTS